MAELTLTEVEASIKEKRGQLDAIWEERDAAQARGSALMAEVSELGKLQLKLLRAEVRKNGK